MNEKPDTSGLSEWLTPQEWARDCEGPIVALGEEGAFDDTHLFAPCVTRENGNYLLWYPGSRGEVAERVFKMGLCTSDDGVHFTRHPDNPIWSFPDGKHSVLTPTLVRNPDGSLRREQGRIRMFCSSTAFPGDGRHTLHDTTSQDGIHWSDPSEALLENLYAPTILFEDGHYHLWYVDVSMTPWSFRYASSADGKSWDVLEDPVLVVDQEWERDRLFYPTVLKSGGVYLMWYGSYWRQQPHKTALGFAVSEDGRTWVKNPHNPVFTPEPSRPWESHYTTSQSILRLPDGSWRIWYATRCEEVYKHKYFAIGTARCNQLGPGA